MNFAIHYIGNVRFSTVRLRVRLHGSCIIGVLPNTLKKGAKNRLAVVLKQSTIASVRSWHKADKNVTLKLRFERTADILVQNISLNYSEVIFDQRYSQLNKQEVKKYEQAIM